MIFTEIPAVCVECEREETLPCRSGLISCFLVFPSVPNVADWAWWYWDIRGSCERVSFSWGCDTCEHLSFGVVKLLFLFLSCGCFAWSFWPNTAAPMLRNPWFPLFPEPIFCGFVTRPSTLTFLSVFALLPGSWRYVVSLTWAQVIDFKLRLLCYFVVWFWNVMNFSV